MLCLQCSNCVIHTWALQRWASDNGALYKSIFLYLSSFYLAFSSSDPLQDNGQQDVAILYVLLLLLLLHTGWFHVVVSPLWTLSAKSSLVFLSFSCPPSSGVQSMAQCAGCSEISGWCLPRIGIFSLQTFLSYPFELCCGVWTDKQTDGFESYPRRQT